MTFIDARTLPNGHRIEADICIVGAGAAGLAIASELDGRSIRVALLESGGLKYDDTTQDLYKGEIIGRPHHALDLTRFRYFGGSTNYWAGNVRPLDAIDFLERPWLPFGGWPMSISALEPYYDRARRFLRLPEDAFNAQAWDDSDKYRRWDFEKGRVRTDAFQRVAPQNLQLGKTLHSVIEKSENIQTYLYANVLEIVPSNPPELIRFLRVATLEGKHFRAYAKYFILATGGIENARLLLLSSSVQKAGLGNQNGLVGRFFANHLRAREICELYPSNPRIQPGYYMRRAHATGQMRGIFSLSEEVQRKEGLLNLRFQIARVMNIYQKARPHDGVSSFHEVYDALKKKRVPEDLEVHIADMIADVDNLAAYGYDHLRYRDTPPISRFSLTAIAEQLPNPDSRIMLGNGLDPLRQRRVALDWRLSELDTTSIQRTVGILAQESGASGLGRIRYRQAEEGLSSLNPGPMNHHMGTTRMNDHPKMGVVDRNCRVHGINNLFVAGSSVFPTSGHANPTFTILALAFRLSDHLRGVLR